MCGRRARCGRDCVAATAVAGVVGDRDGDGPRLPALCMSLLSIRTKCGTYVPPLVPNAGFPAAPDPCCCCCCWVNVFFIVPS